MTQSQGHRDSESSGSRGPLRSPSKSQKKPKNPPKEQQTEEVAQGAAESRKRSRSRGPNKKLDKKKKDKKADRGRAHVVAKKKGAVPNARAAVPVSRPAVRAARAHFHPAVAVRAAVLLQFLSEMSLAYPNEMEACMRPESVRSAISYRKVYFHEMP